MSVHSWTVDVDGVSRQIVLEPDPTTGKTAIRVDGRMAARALTAEDEEREFKVGSATYLVRRMADGSWDLDFAPPDLTNPQTVPTWTAPGVGPRLKRPEVQPKSELTKKIFAAVASTIVAAVLAWGWDTLSYWRVDWQPYTERAGAFRVAFPGEPERRERDFDLAGETVTQVILSSSYRNHGYITSFFDLPVFVDDAHADTVLQSALNSWLKAEQATLVAKESGWLKRHHAVEFIAQLPKTDKRPKAAVRGKLALFRGERLYIFFTVVPPRHTMSYDVGEYLRSIDLPDPRPTPTS